MIYKLALGDWSEDGHGISKDVLIDCNCESVTDIQNAYKTSCKKLGVQFNEDEGYTGKNLPYGDPHLIWTGYQESDMSPIAYDILNKAGCFDGIDIEENDDGSFPVVTLNGCRLEEHAKVIINFIALSMPKDFRYQIVKKNYPYINGHWDSNLNVGLGYGLFDNI